MASIKLSHETLVRILLVMSQIAYCTHTARPGLQTTLRAKVIVAGDACVGKTALCKVAANMSSEFPKNYVMVRRRVVETVGFHASYCARVPSFKQTTAVDLHVKTVRIRDAATPTQVKFGSHPPFMLVSSDSNLRPG